MVVEEAALALPQEAGRALREEARTRESSAISFPPDVLGMSTKACISFLRETLKCSKQPGYPGAEGSFTRNETGQKRHAMILEERRIKEHCFSVTQ